MFRNLSMEGLGISGRQREALELALSLGFQAIELDMDDFAAPVQLYDLPHALRLIDSSHLRVGHFQPRVSWAASHDADRA